MYVRLPKHQISFTHQANQKTHKNCVFSHLFESIPVRCRVSNSFKGGNITCASERKLYHICVHCILKS